MARSKAAVAEEAGVCPFTSHDFSVMEDQLRQLMIAHKTCERCARCNIPVDAARADIEALMNYYQGILHEFRGPQAPIPGPQS